MRGGGVVTVAGGLGGAQWGEDWCSVLHPGRRTVVALEGTKCFCTGRRTVVPVAGTRTHTMEYNSSVAFGKGYTVY